MKWMLPLIGIGQNSAIVDQISLTKCMSRWWLSSRWLQKGQSLSISIPIFLRFYLVGILSLIGFQANYLIATIWCHFQRWFSNFPDGEGFGHCWPKWLFNWKVFIRDEFSNYFILNIFHRNRKIDILFTKCLGNILFSL